MKDKLKVSKWDILFQIVFYLIVIGLLPATRIIINYSQYSWVMAIVLTILFIVMSRMIHNIQLREQRKSLDITFSDDEKHIHVEGKGIYTLDDMKVGKEE